MSQSLKILLLTIFCFGILFCWQTVVFADNGETDPKTGLKKPTLQITIPTVNFDKVPRGLWIGEYIRGVYRYVTGVIGILAAVVLMFAGLMWLTAGGSTTRVSEAKAWIGAALTGLVLALSSYMILYIINPDLVTFKNLNISSSEKKVTTGYGGGAEGIGLNLNSPILRRGGLGKIEDLGNDDPEIQAALANIFQEGGYPGEVTFDDQPPELPTPTINDMGIAIAGIQEMHNTLRININDPVTINRPLLSRYDYNSLIDNLNLDEPDFAPPAELENYISPYIPDEITPPPGPPPSIPDIGLAVAGLRGMYDAIPTNDPVSIERDSLTGFDYNAYFANFADIIEPPPDLPPPPMPPDIPDEITPLPGQIPSIPDLGLAMAGLRGMYDAIPTNDPVSIERDSLTGFDYNAYFANFADIIEPPEFPPPEMPPDIPYEPPQMPTLPDIDDAITGLHEIYNNMEIGPIPIDISDLDFNQYIKLATPKTEEYAAADYIDYVTGDTYEFPPGVPPPSTSIYARNENSEEPSLNITNLPDNNGHEGTIRYRDKDDVDKILNSLKENFPDYKIIVRSYEIDDPDIPKEDKYGLFTGYIRLVPRN